MIRNQTFNTYDSVMEFVNSIPRESLVTINEQHYLSGGILFSVWYWEVQP